MATKYKLLALDVDGTLLGPDHEIPPDHAQAIVAAQEAGLRVCLATGRSYIETIGVWRKLPLREPFEPMVLIGGALVAEPQGGRTLYQRTIPGDLARRYAAALVEAGYSAMGIVDAWRWGVDYYLAESADAQRVVRDWFGRMKVTVRKTPALCAEADMPPPLRINAVVPPDQAGELADHLARRFGAELNIHAIYAPNYDVMIVEAFALEASKWTGLQYVAQAYRIGAGQIVAAGDDVNDIAMLSRAGLGVAMSKAPAAVKSAARLTAERGLADVIHRMLAGEFDA